MKKKIEEAFKTGLLYNMIKKAETQTGDKTEFQSNPGDSSSPDDPKGKKNFFKDNYPREQRIEHAIDAVDAGMGMGLRGKA